MSCGGGGGGGRGGGRQAREEGVETRKPSTSPPRGPLLLFVTSSVPEVAGVTKTVQKIAPLPRPRKLMREVTSQRSSRPVPGRCKKGKGLASKTFPHLLAAERPCRPSTRAPLSCPAMAPRGAHPQLLALGSVGKCRRFRNSSNSLGTSWFRYRTPWRDQRAPVIRPSCVTESQVQNGEMGAFQNALRISRESIKPNLGPF